MYGERIYIPEYEEAHLKGHEPDKFELDFRHPESIKNQLIDILKHDVAWAENNDSELGHSQEKNIQNLDKIANNYKELFRENIDFKKAKRAIRQSEFSIVIQKIVKLLVTGHAPDIETFDQTVNEIYEDTEDVTRPGYERLKLELRAKYEKMLRLWSQDQEITNKSETSEEVMIRHAQFFPASSYYEKTLRLTAKAVTKIKTGLEDGSVMSPWADEDGRQIGIDEFLSTVKLPFADIIIARAELASTFQLKDGPLSEEDKDLIMGESYKLDLSRDMESDYGRNIKLPLIHLGVGTRAEILYTDDKDHRRLILVNSHRRSGSEEDLLHVVIHEYQHAIWEKLNSEVVEPQRNVYYKSEFIRQLNPNQFIEHQNGELIDEISANCLNQRTGDFRKNYIMPAFREIERHMNVVSYDEQQKKIAQGSEKIWAEVADVIDIADAMQVWNNRDDSLLVYNFLNLAKTPEEVLFNLKFAVSRIKLLIQETEENSKAA